MSKLGLLLHGGPVDGARDSACPRDPAVQRDRARRQAQPLLDPAAARGRHRVRRDRVADSTATVIGAMIVAPLMTPILGTVVSIGVNSGRPQPRPEPGRPGRRRGAGWRWWRWPRRRGGVADSDADGGRAAAELVADDLKAPTGRPVAALATGAVGAFRSCARTCRTRCGRRDRHLAGAPARQCGNLARWGKARPGRGAACCSSSPTTWRYC